MTIEFRFQYFVFICLCFLVFTKHVCSAFGAKSVVIADVKAFLSDSIPVYQLKTIVFQMSPFSDHLTLNSISKFLRSRSSLMETRAQNGYVPPCFNLKWSKGNGPNWSNYAQKS